MVMAASMHASVKISILVHLQSAIILFSHNTAELVTTTVGILLFLDNVIQVKQQMVFSSSCSLVQCITERNGFTIHGLSVNHVLCS